MCRSIVLLLVVSLLAVVPRARAVDGPYVGVDVGASVPQNNNYASLTNVGITGNPFGGYMFNRYLGVQGTLQFVYQAPDGNVHGFPHAQQTTTMLGATGGPRLVLPFNDITSLYLTGEGGYFTGLSGRMTHSAPGFSIGGGFEYNVTPQVAVGLFGRFNRTYMSPRPITVASFTPDEQGPADAQWATAGIHLRYSFNQPEEQPPPPPPPPMAQKAPPAKRKIVLRSVYFDFNKSNIRPDAVPVLNEAVRLLNDDRGVPVLVIGHTDNIGTEAYNLKLSWRRADAVRNYLVSHGVAGTRIRTEGLGESQPVASNDTADGRQQNRRVELHLE